MIDKKSKIVQVGPVKKEDLKKVKIDSVVRNINGRKTNITGLKPKSR